MDQRTVICFAVVIRRKTATAASVAAETLLSTGEAQQRLESLVRGGYLRRIGTLGYRAWRLAGEVPGYPGALAASSPETLSKRESRREIGGSVKDNLRDRSVARTRTFPTVAVGYVNKQYALDCDEAFRTKGAVFGPATMLGRWIRLWEKHYGIDYKPAITLERDLQSCGAIIEAEGELAPWCADAMFDKALQWVTSKTLDFVARPDHRNKHVRPIAVELRRASGGTLQQRATGKVHVPGK